MADNILDSYFVKIAALADVGSFFRLKNILRDADVSVDTFAGSAIKSLIEFEAASLGVFSAISIGLISLTDKTAMTDQSYRLMGLRFLMTKSSARSMQLALDELGATIDEVAYDPELNKRFQYLFDYNQRLGKTLGANFDKNMQSIRDLRMEYKMFGTELEFLVGGVVSSLFEKLGFTSEDALYRLSTLNEWFSTNLPSIVSSISTNLIPAWQDSVVVIKDFGSELKVAAGDFTFLSGVLLGDKSIQSTTFSIKDSIKAIGDWLDFLAEGILSLQLLGKVGLHVFTGLTAAIEGWNQARLYNFKETDKFWEIAHKEFSAAKADTVDLFSGSNAWRNNPDFSGIASHEKDLSGRPNSSDDSSGIKRFLNPNFTPTVDVNQSSKENLTYLEQKYGQMYNLNPDLIAAVIKNESSGIPGSMSAKGAQGLMQLMPGTAKEYGADNPLNPEQNIRAGSHYLSDLLNEYGDLKLALAAYNAGPGNVDKYHGMPPFSETQNYVDSVIKDFTALNSATQATGGQVNISSVTINVPHELPDKDWSRFVHESMTDMLSKVNRNTMAQTAGGSFF